MQQQQQTLRFTKAERLMLEGAAQRLTAATGRPHALVTCAEDGDEWAALAHVNEDFDAEEGEEGEQDCGDPALSVQVTNEPGRRCVVLGPDGREVFAGDDLSDALPVGAYLIAKAAADAEAAALIASARGVA